MHSPVRTAVPWFRANPPHEHAPHGEPLIQEWGKASAEYKAAPKGQDSGLALLEKAAYEKSEPVRRQYTQQLIDMGWNSVTGDVLVGMAQAVAESENRNATAPAKETPTVLVRDTKHMNRIQEPLSFDDYRDNQVESVGWLVSANAEEVEAFKAAYLASPGVTEDFRAGYDFEMANRKAVLACAKGGNTTVDFPSTGRTTNTAVPQNPKPSAPQVSNPDQNQQTSQTDSAAADDDKLSPAAIAGIVVSVLVVLGATVVALAPMLGIALPALPF